MRRNGEDNSVVFPVKRANTTPMGFDSANANSIIELGLYPVLIFEQEKPGKYFKIPFDKWPKVIEHSKTRSLRCIAKEYGVSYEAIRRILRYHNKISEVTC